MNFKHEKDKMLFFKLHPILQLIIMDMNWYSVVNFGIPLTVTATISTELEDKKLGRVSSSHQHGIACDIRARILSKEQQKELSNYINSNKKYVDYKYLSRSGKKRLAFVHDNGNGIHFHTQIHRKFAIKQTNWDNFNGCSWLLFYIESVFCSRMIILPTL